MVEQIKHEAEVSRQHARYRIPARIHVDGDVFSLREWSVSGFSTDHVGPELGRKGHHAGSVEFDTGDFRLLVDIEFEVREYDPDTGLMRARFVNMNRRNVSLLHQIINAYLAGDVLTAGDVLEVAARNPYVNKARPDADEEPGSGIGRAFETIRRITGYAAMLTVLVGLVSFIGFTIYNRLFVVEALSARIQGNVITLRAPDNGIFEIPQGEARGAVGPGELLGVIRLIGGGVASIPNPCNCKVVQTHGVEGGFVGRGERLFTLLPESPELFIVALVPFQEVEGLVVGQSARIRLVDGQVLSGRIDRIVASGPDAGPAGSSGGEPSINQSVAEVRILSETAIPPELLDEVATVTFDTFRNG